MINNGSVSNTKIFYYVDLYPTLLFLLDIRQHNKICIYAAGIVVIETKIFVLNNDGFSFLKLIIQVKVAERRYYLTDPKDQLEFLKTFVDDDQS